MTFTKLLLTINLSIQQLEEGQVLNSKERKSWYTVFTT